MFPLVPSYGSHTSSPAYGPPSSCTPLRPKAKLLFLIFSYGCTIKSQEVIPKEPTARNMHFGKHGAGVQTASAIGPAVRHVAPSPWQKQTSDQKGEATGVFFVFRVRVRKGKP